MPQLFDHVDRILVLTDNEFDFLPAARPTHVVHVGPVLDEPEDVEPWSPPWRSDDPRPLVVVTSSSYYQDPRSTLVAACAAVRRVGARAVVTTGAIDPDAMPTGEDIVAARSLPHDQVIPAARAVVTHCGLGTVHRALTHGVPVICQPIGRDQPDVAARVVAAGAGLRLSPKASARQVAHALTRLWTEPTFRHHAREVGDRLRAGADREAYIDELEALARGRTSVGRATRAPASTSRGDADLLP